MAFTAHCFFRSGGAGRRTPDAPYAAVVMMLDEVERALRRAGMVPVSVTCEVWPVPPRPDGNTMMAAIAVEAEPGHLHQPLRQWFQWRHAQWQWSLRTLPQLDQMLTIGGARARVSSDIIVPGADNG